MSLRGRRARLLVGLAVVVVAGAAAALHFDARWRAYRLPDRLPVEEAVEDVVALAEQRADAPAAVRWLRPSRNLRAEGGWRRALVVAPPGRLRVPVTPPSGASLRFAVGVEGTGRRDEDRAGVRFIVSVDGHDVYARDVNPAASRHDRRWFDEHVALPPGSTPMDLELRTERIGGHGAVAGTAGFADVRLVRESQVVRQVARPDAPNVLVVLVDTLRADRLGCYGASPSPSPALDRLAARGLVFEHLVAQASWTMPAVATILTGLHPRDHRLTGWAAGALSNATPTFAERAALAGITTVGTSGNPLVSRRTNFARGFETFVDYAWDERKKNWAPATDVSGPFLGWLERNADKRFLAYLQFMDPHDPYTPPAALRGTPPPGLRPAIVDGNIDAFSQRIGAPEPRAAEPREVEWLRGLYDGEIRGWDAAFADVLAALARHGIEDRTVVVVLADHGEEFFEHGRLKHGSHLYDETTHVPLVIAGPGIAPGRVAEAVQQIDVFPTLARLLGIEAPAGLPGQDLLGARSARPAFSETEHGITPDGKELRLVSVRSDGWKLIHTPALERFELYDLTRDPGERENRYGSAPEGEALLRLLQTWEASAPPRPASRAEDPALHERLRALGYVR